MALLDARRHFDHSKKLHETGFYHSFELPNGTRIEGCMPVEYLRDRWRRLGLPDQLNGKRLLDIGAWDGWFSFEAERRGAEVTAVDCVEIANFRTLHRHLGSRVDYRVLDFYELPRAGLGQFDYVLFLGVLYHLKHPLLALEIVCELTREIAVVDSYIMDSDTGRDATGSLPIMEFYEVDELGGHLDNWIGPTLGCLQAMLRSAGFARQDLLRAEGHNAVIRCHRRWEQVPDRPPAPAPVLHGAIHNRNGGINFTTGKEEYISCWLATDRYPVIREQLLLDVDGAGVPCLFVRRDAGNTWLANFRVPLGLAPGWKMVRVRFPDSDFSNARRIALDMPASTAQLVLASACGARSAAVGRSTTADTGYLSLWIKGLADNCDRANVKVWLGEERLVTEYVGEPDENGFRQVNAGGVPDSPGQHKLRVAFGSASSNVIPFEVLS
jgi:tRNA (mo5U34)-methyltransferase